MTKMLLFLYFVLVLNNPQSLIISIGFIDFLKTIYTLVIISKGSYEQILHSMPFDKLLLQIFK